MMEMAVTDDAFLGDRLTIRQPKEGYRAAMDPVLLAAAAPLLTKGRVLDVGSGVGTAGFCYLTRVAGPELVSLEIDPLLVDLARHNADTNNLAERATLLQGDLLNSRSAALTSNGFDLVLTNPPYLRAGHADRPPNAIKDRANVEGAADLKKWIAFCLRMLRQKGTLVMIHRADRVDEILCHLQGKVGDLAIIPLWPRQGRDAKRVIIRGRKAIKGPTRLSAGLVLHPDDGQRYSSEAIAILRDGGALEI
ncbi:tRNA1(Val) (adenine(37)-N6)-methyltransferase [Aestuariispira insulae]|uniref:tRNA1(Val) A37 N6-methylase TrmN6 n=1 Tax=Aestuariispira insulae TaxID=1461337 RepID=A0A3D9HW36_9PROT|nr:methyltransferase [Aestuariispira insulae]RED53698.1 tRNA1(Val) A37 N6-methylase TrmN6 [Aestuariispira insulae]